VKRRDVLVGGVALAGCASMGESTQTQRPIVIAHRGASAYRPEHTLSAYRLAIEQGADFIEPDLVMTRDGVLVCRHENEISGTTDVADRPEFADRRKEKVVDGVTATGWWVEDFDLGELRDLRCKERLPQLRPGNAAYDGQDYIPTFLDALNLAQRSGVGIYPELKHPSFLQAQGLDPVGALVNAVQQMGGQAAADIMYVQCFETGAIEQLARMSSLRWTCVQLLSSSGGPWDRRDTSYASMLTDDGLRAMRDRGVTGLGVEKNLIIPRDSSGRSLPPTDLVSRAHAQGFVVHPWTMRPENYFLPAELRRGDASAPDYMRQHGDFDAELRAFYAAGVNGVFSDAPDAAVRARA
jgi:glycerophosphoryl diester phosphodiesterase